MYLWGSWKKASDIGPVLLTGGYNLWLSLSQPFYAVLACLKTITHQMRVQKFILIHVFNECTQPRVAALTNMRHCLYIAFTAFDKTQKKSHRWHVAWHLCCGTIFFMYNLIFFDRITLIWKVHGWMPNRKDSCIRFWRVKNATWCHIAHPLAHKIVVKHSYPLVYLFRMRTTTFAVCYGLLILQIEEKGSRCEQYCSSSCCIH